jgi:hypothetical protein
MYQEEKARDRVRKEREEEEKNICKCYNKGIGRVSG